MPRWNLNANEMRIVTSWLFEPVLEPGGGGYLDNAIRTDGQTARQALTATPTLDVTNWIRTNTRHTNTSVANWEESAMVWFLRSRDNVNITPGNKPPETAAWITILTAWKSTIDDAFTKEGPSQRDAKTVPIYDSSGVLESNMGAGLQLLQQVSLIDKTLAVFVAV